MRSGRSSRPSGSSASGIRKRLKIVTELGYANIAAGVAGAAVLAWPSFIVPMAIYGAIFYGLAGIEHITNTGRTRVETIALVTDLAIAVILAVSAVIGTTQKWGLSP
ncbi:MAG: hypothetical protein AB7O56_03910 [Bauldia sp.]